MKAHIGTGGSWHGPATQTLTVTLPSVATTTGAISVAPTTGRVGEDVTLSTRVSANHGTNTPTGEVRFTVDGQTRTANVVNGVATTTTSFSTAGSKSVTATYLPSTTNQWSGSSRTRTFSVSTEATRTNLTLDPVEVLAGGTVQASASVNPPGAEGDIEFTAGGDPIRVPVGADGTATAELPADTTGEMTVTATFIPANPERYSESSDSQTVDVFEQTSTSTEVSVDADPVQAGQETTLTAAVSPETAAGAVDFTIDGETYPATVTNGTATLNHTFATAGERVVVADFTPTNAERYESSSGELTVNVEAEATQTALTLDPVEVTAGGQVSATARVTPADAAGEVRFDYGDQSRTVDVTDGQAATTFTAQGAGTGTVTATFLPSDTGRYEESSDTQTVEITAETTQTGLTLDSAEVIEGDTVRASASVTPVGAEGDIEFSGVGEPIRVPVGANGTATADLVASTVGEMTVTATFIPTNPQRYAGSSTSQTVNVLEQIATSTSIAVGTDPVRAAEETTLTATVAPANVAGTVTFTIDGQEYPAEVTDGVATLDHTFTTAGQYPVTADFTPDNTDRYIASTGETTVNVEVEATQTALTLDPVEVTAGGEVTATARITPAEAEGRIRFDYGDQTQTIDVDAGEATTTFTTGNAGTDTITATFLPANAQRYEESSDSQTVTVEAEATQTALTLDPIEVVAGGTVVASATVTPAGAEGIVEFTGGEAPVTATVLPDGTATAELTAGTAGEMTVTATFVPANADRYSGSSDSQTVDITAEATQTDLTLNPVEVTAGGTVTATANITPANADGRVEFTVGSQSQTVDPVDGTATAEFTLDTAGEATVTATFIPADPDRYTGSSDEASVTVDVEATTTELTAGTGPARVDEDTTLTATVTPGADGTVTFTIDGTDTDYTAEVQDGIATATHVFDSAGRYPVTAEFTPADPARYSGSTGQVTVNVEAETTDTDLTLGPVEVTAGGTVTATATVTPAEAQGRVEFTVGSQSQTVDPVGGTATAEFTLDTAGEATVTATFIPADPDRYTSSSDTQAVNVEAERTQTTLSVDPVEVAVGDTVTATASVTPTGIDGDIEFIAGDTTVTVAVDSDGNATAELPATAAGQLTVTATFTPADTNRYNGSADMRTVDVQGEDVPAPTTVTADPVSSAPGEEVRLIADGLPADAEGQVRFTIDGVTHTVPVVDGVAVLLYTPDEVGEYTVLVEFVPADTDAYAPSSTTTTITVGTDEDTDPEPVDPGTGSLGTFGLFAALGSLATNLGLTGALGSS